MTQPNELPADVQAVIDDVAARMDWLGIEKEHAIACLRGNLDYSRSFGEEAVMVAGGGRELRYPAYPQSVDYMRVTQQGFELGYWTRSEWEEDTEVMHAVMGSLNKGSELVESPDLTLTFGVAAPRERQGGRS